VLYKCFLASNGPEILSPAMRIQIRRHIADTTKIHGSEVQIVCQSEAASYKLGFTFTEDVQVEQVEELESLVRSLFQNMQIELDTQVVPLPTAH